MVKKKPITPDGYMVVENGNVLIGDMVWNTDTYYPVLVEPSLDVGSLVSVVRPIVSEQHKILEHLRELCKLVPQVKIQVPQPHVNGTSHIIIQGHCGRMIASLEFHRGGKLKKADTQ